jgi:tRNA(Ile)-lysidine synthase
VRAADAALAIGDDELAALFAPLDQAKLIALAVSGGADSLALTDCVARWRSARGGSPGVIVLTVDHRLRRGSSREARDVVALAEGYGLPARVLVRKGPRPTTNVEAVARHDRYRLLLAAAADAGATHLVLAHHRDDQAETFLLRLQRSAGVFGLAAMRPLIDTGTIVIARPLLNVARARLAATAIAAGLTPVDDPMNSDPAFARVRVRKLMPLLAAEGLDASSLADAAARLGQAAAAIDDAATDLLRAAVETDGLAVAWLEPEIWSAAPLEVRLRALVRLLMAIGGDDYPARRDRLEALTDALAVHRRGRFKRTLAGTVIEWRKGRFALYREFGRTGLPVIRLSAGLVGTWDRRFRFAVVADVPSGLTLGALGEEGRVALGLRADAVPAGALTVLPAVRKGAKILAVPPLGATGGGGNLAVVTKPMVGERLVLPPLFPDFTEE